jgi:hypothetical protein
MSLRSVGALMTWLKPEFENLWPFMFSLAFD